jgi:hypothetical protein
MPVAVFFFLLLGSQVHSAVIPAGTRVEATLQSAVQTASSNTGDAIGAVLAVPIRAGANIIVPQGSRLNGRIETIEPATSQSEGRVRLVFREIQLPDGRRVSTWITNAFTASPPNRKLRYVLGVGIGATVGGLIGGKTARVSGILGGTLIGAIIAGSSGHGKLPDLALKPGQKLRLEFGEDLKLE